MEWLLALKDSMAGPAGKAADSAKRLASELKGSAEAAAKHEVIMKQEAAAAKEAAAGASQHVAALKQELKAAKSATDIDEKRVSELEREIREAEQAAFSAKTHATAMGKEETAAKEAAAAIKKEADANEKANAEAQKTAQAGLDKELELIKGGWLAVAAAAAAAAAAIGVVVVKAAEATLEGHEFARTTKGQFEAFTGAAAGGEQAFRDIIAAAKDTAAPLEEVRKTYGTLLATGVEGQLLQDLVRMRFDFMAMGEEAEAAFGKVSDAMVEGKISASMFEDMSKNLGKGGRQKLGQALGLNEFALSMKGGVDEVAELDRQLALVNPQRFLEAVRDIHKAKSGLGEVALQSATIGQLWDSFKATTFATIGESLGLDFAGVFKDAQEWIQSGDGQELVAILKDAAEAGKDLILAFGAGLGAGLEFDELKAELKDVVAQLKDPGTRAAIEMFGHAVGRVIDVGLDFAMVLGEAIPGAVRVAAPIIDMLVGTVAGLSEVMVEFGDITGEVWNVLSNPPAWFEGMGIGFKAEVGTISGGLVSLKSTLDAAWISLASEAVNWGMSLIDGFVAGIMSGLGKISAAASSIADAAKGAITGDLEIGSPSDVTYDYGYWTTEGLGKGMVDNDNASRAASQVVDDVKGTFEDAEPFTMPPPQVVPLFAVDGSASPMGAGGGTTQNFYEGAFQIHVHGSNSAEVASDLESELADILRRVA